MQHTGPMSALTLTLSSTLMPLLRHTGINCGVLLIRNTDWAREFFADVIQYAYMPKEELEASMRPVRNRPTPNSRGLMLCLLRRHQL